MSIGAKLARIVALVAGAATVGVAAFPPAAFGDRLDFLLYHRDGFASGMILRALAGIAVAAAIFVAYRSARWRELWVWGRTTLETCPRSYAAIFFGIGALSFVSSVSLAAIGVCLQPDSVSYLTFSPERTIGYPLFLMLVGVGSDDLVPLLIAQSGLLLGALAVLAYQLGRVCNDRLAAVIAYALMAGNASLLGYAGSMLTEALFVTLLALHLAAVAALCVGFRWAVACAAGLLLGVAILVRPAGYAFLGTLPAFLLLLPKRRLTGTITVALAAALPLLGAATANQIRHGFFATQSIGGYSLLGHTAHLIEPGMASGFGDLPARIAEVTATFRFEIVTARFPHEAWRVAMNAYNAQLYGAVLPTIEAWRETQAPEIRPGMDSLVARLAREAIRHDPVGYARQFSANYYGLWLLTFLPHGPMAARQLVCLSQFGQLSAPAGLLTPIDLFWAGATFGQFPAVIVAFIACWLAIPLWFFASGSSPVWRFTIYAALGVNAYFLGFATTQVALPRYTVVVEPWLVALLVGLCIALAHTHAQERYPASH